MGLETLPFACPRLASVAAFVGKEREWEREQREERVRNKEREEALTEFGELAREVSHLVFRLAQMHDNSLEVLCDAVHGARSSPVAALLRRFLAETDDLLASHLTHTPLSAGPGRRASAAKMTPESIKSRAHRADLFLKLSIRKTWCSPAERTLIGGMSCSPRNAEAMEEKQRGPKREGGWIRSHRACEVRANWCCVLKLCPCDRPCVPVQRSS